MIEWVKRYVREYVTDRLQRKYWCRGVVPEGRKRALLSYIVRPFRTESTVNHTNDIEARLLAEALADLGYAVDVVACNFRGEIDYGRYDLVLGQGYPIERSFRPGVNVRRVYYATGCDCCQRNRSEIERVVEFRQSREADGAGDVYPTRQKQYPDYVSGSLSDAVLCSGNSFTLGTYDTRAVPIVESVDLPVQELVEPHWIDRDHDRTRTHFVWFGGRGAVLKGMDLCVRAVQDLGDATLHLCGPHEGPVFDALSDELATPNVVHHGFVDPGTEMFREIMAACSFVLFPSVSEGGGGSVLTAMTTGLIPVVTDGASIDRGDFGIRIDFPTVSAVRDAVRSCMQMPASVLADRSGAAFRRIRDDHTAERYTQAVRSVRRRVEQGADTGG